MCGCQGSGKTLVLCKVVRNFLSNNSKGDKVFIVVYRMHLLLQEQLRQAFASTDNQGSDGRVVICDYQNLCHRDDLTYHSLILVDEAVILPGPKFHPDHAELYKTISQVKNIVLFSSQQLFTADNVAKAYEKIGLTVALKSFSLSGNLRSSQAITQLVLEYQSVVVKTESANIPVTTVLKFDAFGPEIKVIDDKSKAREELLRECEKVFDAKGE